MIGDVIDCQTKLIAALDARDADAILSASTALAQAVEREKLQKELEKTRLLLESRSAVRKKGNPE